ncbi:tubulin-tyrosine ligase family domain-containing protein [Neospora caninum Liverpool]|uniref:Tubulin-tyrosine ligase family domain-containing protein n=1 Tax=Neospora caninum (strain Liverpool) TaxID=572307 RepID=F0VHW9_NEOCL|nr:tubulin-tyrosine ligase family domain-containing protein [Neospora caninum Liverpool]CBZ53330.1 tubulin-tyrosine ligase family domain-containing protein [Neospora caninum Liverpool]|eukprot:XP_003883362.1 tubulin-tyrosine ligase family domain-containing protein [Neospora caninum Liverpool]
MRPYQKINHFVGTNAISRKNYLARNLLRMKAYYPKEYKFFPHTWSLPADLADFRCQFTGRRRKTFIIKPDASSQGRGIFLTRNIEDIDPTEHLVAQRYLHKPFLIDGLKFDLRIYVLLAGCNPLRLFVHQDGLVRFATSPYAKPTGKNLHDKTMHLTNYAINKSSSNFTPNRDPANPSKGHKRSLFHVLDHLKSEGHDVDALCKEIDECLCKTIIAIQPSLAHIYGSCKGEDLSNSMCFEVLGIDIMIDHKLTPWLIEVNHSPSFSTDSDLDTIVKFKVIRDALVLLGLSSENRRKYQAQQRLQAEQRRMAFPKQTREERLQDRRQMMHELAKNRTAWEDAHMGGWRRIYPTEERATNVAFSKQPAEGRRANEATEVYLSS